MLEIDRMLTLSTAHITPTTAQQIDEYLVYFAEPDPNHRPCEEPEQQFDGCSIYPKADYGWFIYIGDAKDDPEKFDALPFELAYLIAFALNEKCTWLCLDRDGDVIDTLVSYEW